MISHAAVVVNATPAAAESAPRTMPVRRPQRDVGSATSRGRLVGARPVGGRDLRVLGNGGRGGCGEPDLVVRRGDHCLAVRDHDDGGPPSQPPERLEQHGLGLGVEVRRGLVEQHERAVREQHPRQDQPRPLSGRPAGPVLAEHRVDPVGRGCHQLAEPYLLERRPHVGIGRVRPADPDVVREASGDQPWPLRQPGDLPLPGRRVGGEEVVVADPDAAVAHGTVAAAELAEQGRQKRGLATAGRARDGGQPGCGEVGVDPFEGRRRAVRPGHGQAAHRDRARTARRQRRTVGRGWGVEQRRCRLEARRCLRRRRGTPPRRGAAARTPPARAGARSSRSGSRGRRLPASGPRTPRPVRPTAWPPARARPTMRKRVAACPAWPGGSSRSPGGWSPTARWPGGARRAWAGHEPRRGSARRGRTGDATGAPPGHASRSRRAPRRPAPAAASGRR